MIKIREATIDDAARLVEIYSYYVLNLKSLLKE